MKITFVCTGNTCRSPMAEGICRAILKERNISYIICQSCGLSAFAGDTACKNAVTAASEYGADITPHRSRQISRYIIDESDLIVCMTVSHAQALKSVCTDKRIILPAGGVPDPYGGDIEVYKNCARLLYNFIFKLIESLTMQIIPMGKEHIASITEIERLSFSVPWSENALSEELSNESAHFLTAICGDEVLGYIGVHEICGEAYITNIAVLPEYRRLGIGEKLIKKAADDAKMRNCEFISLEVRKSNSPAIELYKKEGYNTVGERKAFYTNPTEDALIMTKTLIKDEKNENSRN